MTMLRNLRKCIKLWELMGFWMSLGDFQGWLRRLAGWLAGWGDEEGKVRGLESQGCGVGNSTLKCCFGEMLSRHRCGVEMERLEAEKHKDSYIWMGTEGRKPGWREGIRTEGKGTLTMLR